MIEAKAREFICEMGRSMFERRLTFGSSGNISMKIAGISSAAFCWASQRRRTMPSARERRSTMRRWSWRGGRGISRDNTKSISARGIRAPELRSVICATVRGDLR